MLDTITIVSIVVTVVSIIVTSIDIYVVIRKQQKSNRHSTK